MLWSVINFIDDNTVEVVPSFWVNKTSCAWPKRNAKKFIKDAIAPNEFDFDYLPAKRMCHDLGNIKLTLINKYLFINATR